MFAFCPLVTQNKSQKTKPAMESGMSSEVDELEGKDELGDMTFPQLVLSRLVAKTFETKFGDCRN